MVDRQLTVVEAIDLHRASVFSDEQSYDDDGKIICAEVAKETGEVEADAFVRLCKAQCVTDADVQAKVTYFANEKVGIRSTSLECLTHEEYGGYEALGDFIRSLQLVEKATIDGEAIKKAVELVGKTTKDNS